MRGANPGVDPLGDAWERQMSKLVLYTENFSGNLHMAARLINHLGMAEHVLTMSSVNGNNTIVVYRLPSELRDELWKRNGRTGEPA